MARYYFDSAQVPPEALQVASFAGTEEISRLFHFDTVDDYAGEQVKVIEGELHSCRVLKKEPVTLDSGLPAYRAIFVWYPTEDLKVYQEQLYVLHDGTGYRLTATFSRKTRKLLGPQIERIMLGFTPE